MCSQRWARLENFPFSYIFPRTNFHLGTPETNFSGFKKWQAKKTNKQTNKKKNLCSFHNIFPLPFFSFPPPFLTISLLFLSIFPFFLASVFPFILSPFLPKLPKSPPHFPRVGDSPTSPTSPTPSYATAW